MDGFRVPVWRCRGNHRRLRYLHYDSLNVSQVFKLVEKAPCQCRAIGKHRPELNVLFECSRLAEKLSSGWDHIGLSPQLIVNSIYICMSRQTGRIFICEEFECHVEILTWPILGIDIKLYLFVYSRFEGVGAPLLIVYSSQMCVEISTHFYFRLYRVRIWNLMQACNLRSLCFLHSWVGC